jgi:hypothetical protein
MDRQCGTCGSRKVTDHCQNPQCAWVRCDGCRNVTDLKALPGGTGQPGQGSGSP